jgi:hypothetical protein
MPSRHSLIGIGLLMCMGSWARIGAHQESSVVPLPRDSEGRRHVVRLITGEEISGRLLNLGPDELRLLVEGQERNILLADVAQVDRAGDSLKNGAIIGALVVGAWCALVCGQGLDSADQLPVAVAVNAGVGALIGIGIDAANQERTTVYRRPTPSDSRRPKGVVVFRLSF